MDLLTRLDCVLRTLEAAKVTAEVRVDTQTEVIILRPRDYGSTGDLEAVLVAAGIPVTNHWCDYDRNHELVWV